MQKNQKYPKIFKKFWNLRKQDKQDFYSYGCVEKKI